MQYENVAIPVGFARSSPFVRWQGSLAEVPSTERVRRAMSPDCRPI